MSYKQFKITFIRHAKIDGEPALYGRTDNSCDKVALAEITPLTNTYTSVFVSPKNRCIETARALGIISYEITNKIQEFNFGILDGVPFSKYSEIENTHLEKLSADPFYQLPEADNYKEFYKRITLFFKELCKKANNNDHYLIVTHGGIINTVIADILKVNPSTVMFNMSAKHATYTTVSYFIDETAKDPKHQYFAKIEAVNSTIEPT